jgi:hypothetical protein
VDGAADRPVVGLFGAFDTGDLGEVALRRVMETELGRRRPDIDIEAMAPFGRERPIPGDEGRPARGLPPVAAGDGLGADALIVSGDVLAGDHSWAMRYQVAPDVIEERGVAALALTGMRAGAPAAAQVLWFAVAASDDPAVDVGGLAGRDVWVRNRATEERLGGTAAQSGDPVLLAARVFGVDALRRRADLLRMCGALPAGPRLIVEVTRAIEASEGGDELVDALRGALRSDPKLSLIVLSLDPTGQRPETLVNIAGLVAERVHHVPDWAGLDDVAASMSGAAAVVATTPAGAHLAAALGTPAGVVGGGAGGRCAPGIPVLTADVSAGVAALVASGSPLDLTETVNTLDVAFAELCERLPRAPGATTTRKQPDPVASAIAILQQRLVDERTALQAELSRMEAELEHMRSSPEHRIARPIREGYQRWQRRRT